MKGQIITINVMHCGILHIPSVVDPELIAIAAVIKPQSLAHLYTWMNIRLISKSWSALQDLQHSDKWTWLKNLHAFN